MNAATELNTKVYEAIVNLTYTHFHTSKFYVTEQTPIANCGNGMFTRIEKRTDIHNQTERYALLTWGDRGMYRDYDMVITMENSQAQFNIERDADLLDRKMKALEVLGVLNHVS